MNPIQGFSSASSGPQAGLPHNQSRQIGHPPTLIPDAANFKKRSLQLGGRICAGFKFADSELTINLQRLMGHGYAERQSKPI